MRGSAFTVNVEGGAPVKRNVLNLPTLFLYYYNSSICTLTDQRCSPHSPQWTYPSGLFLAPGSFFWGVTFCFWSGEWRTWVGREGGRRGWSEARSSPCTGRRRGRPCKRQRTHPGAAPCRPGWAAHPHQCPNWQRPRSGPWRWGVGAFWKLYAIPCAEIIFPINSALLMSIFSGLRIGCVEKMIHIWAREPSVDQHFQNLSGVINSNTEHIMPLKGSPGMLLNPLFPLFFSIDTGSSLLYFQVYRGLPRSMFGNERVSRLISAFCLLQMFCRFYNCSNCSKSIFFLGCLPGVDFLCVFHNLHVPRRRTKEIRGKLENKFFFAQDRVQRNHKAGDSAGWDRVCPLHSEITIKCKWIRSLGNHHITIFHHSPPYFGIVVHHIFPQECFCVPKILTNKHKSFNLFCGAHLGGISDTTPSILSPHILFMSLIVSPKLRWSWLYWPGRAWHSGSLTLGHGMIFFSDGSWGGGPDLPRNVTIQRDIYLCTLDFPIKTELNWIMCSIIERTSKRIPLIVNIFTYLHSNIYSSDKEQSSGT